MRIALVSTVSTPVTQGARGSIEGLVWLLSREFVAMGHDVTVFGIPGSSPCGQLIAGLPGGYGNNGSPDDWQLCEWINLSRAIERASDFDIIHSNNYLWGLPFERISPTPLVHTLHLCPEADHLRVAALYPGACITAISEFQKKQFLGAASAVVLHGVDRDQFTLSESPEDHVCYFGRFLASKGPLEAIAAARALGLKIKLAGPRNPYFQHHVAPLVDGIHVEYVGQVEGERRNELLGRARALLYPIQAAEPFGLVMPEAMMCGTPVVAIGLGAVPEIIDEGVTGSTATSLDEFKDRIVASFRLNRRRIREVAESRFSGRSMAEGYERVYRDLIDSRRRTESKAQLEGMPR